jgi:uncharacterized lipoprotein YajG
MLQCYNDNLRSSSEICKTMPFTKEVRVGKIVFRVDPDLPRGTFTIGSYMSNNLNDILQQKGLSVNVRGEDFEGKVDRVINSLTERESRVLLREHGYRKITQEPHEVLRKMLTPDYTKISRHVREQFLKRMRLDQALEILRNADMIPPEEYTLEDLRNIIISNNLPIDMRKMKLMDKVPEKPKNPKKLKVDNKGRFLLESKIHIPSEKRQSLSPSKPTKVQRRHSASRLPSYDVPHVPIATTKPSKQSRFLLEESLRKKGVSKRHSLSSSGRSKSSKKRRTSASRLPSYDVPHVQIATTKPSGRVKYLLEESLRKKTATKRHSLSPTETHTSPKRRPTSASRLPSYDVPHVPIATTRPSKQSRFLLEESLRKKDVSKRHSLSSSTERNVFSKRRPTSASRLPSYDVPRIQIASTKPSKQSRFLLEESLRKKGVAKRHSLPSTKTRVSSNKDRRTSASRLPSYDVPQKPKSPESNDSIIPEWFFELPIVSDIFPSEKKTKKTKKTIRVIKYRKHLILAKYHEMYEHTDGTCSFCEHYLQNYHPIIYKRLQNQ